MYVKNPPVRRNTHTRVHHIAQSHHHNDFHRRDSDHSIISDIEMNHTHHRMHHGY